MTKSLIYPSKVVELAFGGKHLGVLDKITTTQIQASELRYIKPALGDFYNVLLSGQYPEFVDNYLASAISLYVKAAILPFLSLCQGEAGLTYFSSTSGLQLSDDDVLLLKGQLVDDANALLSNAVNYLKGHRDEFGEHLDVASLCAVQFPGGVIL